MNQQFEISQAIETGFYSNNKNDRVTWPTWLQLTNGTSSDFGLTDISEIWGV